MTDERFPKELRLRRAAEFARVHASDAYVTDDWLVAKGVVNDLAVTRLGLSVSRKVGNAVTRNRWKRLLREAFRRNKARLPTGLDVVLRPRAGARPDGPAIFASLPKLLRRLAQRLAGGRPAAPPRRDRASRPPPEAP